MTKKELHEVLKRGVASEIIKAFNEYYKDVNFYKRKNPYDVARELFPTNELSST